MVNTLGFLPTHEFQKGLPLRIFPTCGKKIEFALKAYLVIRCPLERTRLAFLHLHSADSILALFISKIIVWESLSSFRYNFSSGVHYFILFEMASDNKSDVSDMEFQDEDIEDSGSESSFSEDTDNDSEDEGEPLQEEAWQELDTSCPPAQPRFYFQGESLVNFEVAPGGSVLQYLELFLDDEMIGHITNEMNRGYVWSTIVYTGKGTILDDTFKNMSMSSQVVMSLMKPLFEKGYCVTTDNFYTSPELAEARISHSCDTYGTVHVTRKGMPEQLKRKKMKKGEVAAFQKGKIMVLQWKDKKEDMAALSNTRPTNGGDLAKFACRKGLSFSGEEDKSVVSFLETCEDFQTSNRASDEDMLRLIPELLKGKASCWFRVNKVWFGTYTEFKYGLKEAY
ncbi:hypothetical protein J437_LFUL017086 [Ladona fulva]|uniref:PiggyBac transposable element-derived protein domain-containing protein n=1 Tax=Ladona fulva TaxID=123851 RepID=A0A8K0P8E6_LADFU|nr:hypothetical protein J437_LFUL017086 [Ladona fulva]